MIIGDGLLAQSLALFDRDDCIFLCSGVSNSNETDISEFQREEALIKDYLSSPKGIIYFSSCFCSDPSFDTPYYKHKRNMEVLVQKADKSFIFRLPQVVGVSKNPNTLINYFANALLSESEIFIIKTKRNLVDVSDIAKITASYLDSYFGKNDKISIIENIANPESYSVEKIINCLVETLMISNHNITCIDKVQTIPIIPLSLKMIEIYDKNMIQFGREYLKKIISRYYY